MWSLWLPGSRIAESVLLYFLISQDNQIRWACPPVSELRKHLLPVAPGCGASVLLKYVVLESARKHDDGST